jgi:hypothetical protein
MLCGSTATAVPAHTDTERCERSKERAESKHRACVEGAEERAVGAAGALDTTRCAVRLARSIVRHEERWGLRCSFPKWSDTTNSFDDPRHASSSNDPRHCGGMSGAAFALCYAYCEAVECNARSHWSCEVLRRLFRKVTGNPSVPCEVSESPTATPVAPTVTVTHTRTQTASATQTATSVAPTSTNTKTPTLTATPEPTHTVSSTATSTELPTSTPIPTAMPACGDALLNQAGEECDPPGSHCSEGRICGSDCRCPAPVCGNGLLDPGETCDGASNAACPGQCKPDCQCPVCGDGIVNQPLENCDPPGTFCSAGRLCDLDCTCPVPACGNGILDPPLEKCDGTDDLHCPGECTLDCRCPGAPLAIHLSFFFVEMRGIPEHAGFAPIDGKPLAGLPAVGLARILGSYRTAHFSLTDENGTWLRALDLAPGGEAVADPGQFLGSVDLPSQPFRIRIEGTTSDDSPYSVTTAEVYRAEPIRIRLTSISGTLQPGSVATVSSELTNTGPDRTGVATGVVSGNAQIISIVPSVVQIQPGIAAGPEITIQLPASPIQDELIKVTLSISSTAPSAASNSASAILALELP